MRKRTLIAVAIGALLSAPLSFAHVLDPPTLGEKSAFYAEAATANASETGIVTSGSVAPDVIGSIELPSSAIHDVDNHATPADGIDLSKVDSDATNGQIFSRDRHMQGESREVPRLAERIRWDVTTTIDGLKHGEFDSIDSS